MTEISDARAINAKLKKAREAVDTVEKKGENKAQNYNYAKAEDVFRAAQAALDGADLIVEFEADRFETEKSESGSMITLISGNLIVTDPDTGFSQRREVLGAGADKPGDKGVFKAMTGARKYALIHLLGIPIGDDPDEERKAGRARGARQSGGGAVLADKRVGELFKLIGQKLTPTGFKGASLPHPGFKQLGVMFGSIGTERPSVNRADSIKKALRALSPDQADQLAKLLAKAEGS